MSDLEPQPLNDNPGFNQDPGGVGSIKKFGSYEYGSSFSRVVRIIHFTGEVVINPRTGNSAFKLPSIKPQDVIVLGRYCNYPNKSRVFWSGIQEYTAQRRTDSITPGGSNPFLGVSFDEFYMDILDSNAALSLVGKIVIQLLFIEL